MTGDTRNGATDPPIVFVVDDDPQVREAIELLLDSVGLKVKTFQSAQAFLRSFDLAQPGCLVLDVRMPGMSGLELHRHLMLKGIHIPTLLLTAHAEVPMAVEALKAGVLDFIEKPYSPQGLLDRIQNALGEDSRIREERLKLAMIGARVERLSRREKEVMQGLVNGQNSRIIAVGLGISEKTVDFHRRNLLQKMQVDTVVELGRMIEFLERSQVAQRGV